MKELWAPWRIEYFKKVKGKGCFLCKSFASSRDRDNLLLKRGKTCVVLMNRQEEMCEMMLLTQQAICALKKVARPHGFNIGVNIGEAAGAGLKDHIHLHIVPRWTGDTNFVTVMADIRIVPQALQELWKELRKVLKG
jgi:ATP adenylyltransferase